MPSCRRGSPRGSASRTLVIVAGKDEVVPDLAAKLPSDVKPVVIDGASHFFLDLYGEEAADAIAKFVQRDRRGEVGKVTPP